MQTTSVGLWSSLHAVGEVDAIVCTSRRRTLRFRRPRSGDTPTPGCRAPSGPSRPCSTERQGICCFRALVWGKAEGGTRASALLPISPLRVMICGLPDLPREHMLEAPRVRTWPVSISWDQGCASPGCPGGSVGKDQSGGWGTRGSRVSEGRGGPSYSWPCHREASWLHLSIDRPFAYQQSRGGYLQSSGWVCVSGRLACRLEQWGSALVGPPVSPAPIAPCRLRT